MRPFLRDSLLPRVRVLSMSSCRCSRVVRVVIFFFFQAEDGIRYWSVTGVQTCALPISWSITSSAAVWTLWAGVIGGWVAVLAGLQAEDVIDHGEAVHELMETHETVALTTMGIFTVVLGWKLFRRSKLTSAEEAGLRVLSVAGLVAIIWTGVLGATLMVEHAAGIPNATLQAEIENREAGHHHEAGEAEEHEHAAPADTAKAAGHTHAPGTPHKP